MKRAGLIALVLSIATPAAAQQYTYVARTEAPVARQGAVTAGILTWQCQGSACSIAGPWPIPSPEACAQLAAEVGRIIEYGRQGRVLDAAGLATCNAGLAPPSAGPTQIYRRSDAPVTGAVVRPAPDGPIAVTAPELSFIVSATADVRAPAASVAITTPQLAFVVAPEALPAAPAETVAVTTPELSFVVR